MQSVAAIIQARMSSSRLPGKVLMPISGMPLIGHVLHRVSRAKTVSEVVLATSSDTSDDPLARWAEGSGHRVFRGDLTDVLERFAGAASSLNSSAIVRITGDCPLIDPEVIDNVVSTFFSQNCDYASNAIVRSYPRGLDVEAMRNKVLQSIRALRTLTDYQREHVTPYIYQNRDSFSIVDVIAPDALNKPDWRWCVDEAADFDFVSRVFQGLYDENPEFRSSAIFELIARNPEILKVNQSVQQKAPCL